MAMVLCGTDMVGGAFWALINHNNRAGMGFQQVYGLTVHPTVDAGSTVVPAVLSGLDGRDTRALWCRL